MISDLEKLAGSFNKVASSEQLQVLAKRAARVFIDKEEDSINSSIKNIVQGENLNKEQIKRITEMTNQAVWKTQFHEGGIKDAFDPGNASSILEELDDSPARQSAETLDYADDPGELKEEFDLGEIFKTEGKEEYPSLNPLSDLEDSHTKAASLKNTAEYSLNTLMRSMEDVSESLYGHIKQAHLRDEIGILQIAKAIGDTVDSERFAVSIMKTAAERLSKEGIFIKTAEEARKAKEPVVVDTEHPLLQDAVLLEKLARSYRHAAQISIKAGKAKGKYLSKIKRTLKK